MNEPMKTAAETRKEIDDFFKDFMYRLKCLKKANEAIMKFKQEIEHKTERDVK
ncbi:hypothetical protein LCGC14_1697470 [marine sediment metagenome]|uniref:Uncharacterized protein n=1 Tax=marine sediment metagenome TaxID=412755 RepID=A0A0F9HJF0_9ZZZZ